MLKRIGLILIMLMIASNFVYAQEPNPELNEMNEKLELISTRVESVSTSFYELSDSIEQQKRDMEEINNKMDSLQTKEDADSSFIQLQDFIKTKVESIIPFFIIILICSDIVLIGYLLLLKARGLF